MLCPPAAAIDGPALPNYFFDLHDPAPLGISELLE
jgi:hypothetical protein